MSMYGLRVATVIECVAEHICVCEWICCGAYVYGSYIARAPGFSGAKIVDHGVSRRKPNIETQKENEISDSVSKSEPTQVAGRFTHINI